MPDCYRLTTFWLWTTPRSRTAQGVTVVQVRPGSAAEGVLRSGDVIVEVNRKPVQNTAETLRQIEQAPQRQPILLKIRRDDHEVFVGVERK
jgi:S1-C subfamily serine protease